MMGVIVTDPRGLIMEANEVIGSMKSETGGKIIDIAGSGMLPVFSTGMERRCGESRL